MKLLPCVLIFKLEEILAATVCACGRRDDGVESKLGVANIDIVVDPNDGLPP